MINPKVANDTFLQSNDNDDEQVKLGSSLQVNNGVVILSPDIYDFNKNNHRKSRSILAKKMFL